MYEWIDEFKQLALNANWTMKQQHSMLKRIINTRILRELRKTDTAEQIYKFLLRWDTSRINATTLVAGMLNTKQHQFRLIRDFITDLERLTQQLATIQNLDKKDEHLMLTTTLLGNLSSHKGIHIQRKKPRNTMKYAKSYTT